MERAVLEGGGIRYRFAFNPDSVAWGYSENVVPTSTIGGKVIQLLSVKVDSMEVTGMAGSRQELQALAQHVFAFMEYHSRSQNPVDFVVPSRRWHFRVYVVGLPAVGWTVATVGYPWRLRFEVDEDLGITTPTILRNELNRLAKGIGYDPRYSGGDVDAWFEGAGTSTDGTGGTGGVEVPAKGTIEEKIRAVWGPMEAKNAIRVARCESGLDPKAIAYEPNGSISRGLFQINNVHEGHLYKKNETAKLFTVDFNIQVAYTLWKQQGWRPWSCAQRLGIV